jgi:hypothetical protein
MVTCKVKTCDKKHEARGLCRTHLARFYRNGHTNLLPKIKKICKIDGCKSIVLARGWCSKHIARFYVHGDPNILLHKTTCTKEGCSNKHCARGLCSRHFEQLRRSEGYHAKHTRKPATRFTDCKRYAKSRGLEWAISFEDYCHLLNYKCTYCGGPLPETKVGLDRIDNNKGYSLDNVVPCCYYCNHLRSDAFTHEEFLEFSKTDLFKKILERSHKRKLFPNQTVGK